MGTVPVVSDEDCNAAYGAAGYAVEDSMIALGWLREERTLARVTVVDPSSATSLPKPGSFLEWLAGALAVEELATLESTLRSLTLLNGSQKQWPPTKLKEEILIETLLAICVLFVDKI